MRCDLICDRGMVGTLMGLDVIKMAAGLPIIYLGLKNRVMTPVCCKLGITDISLDCRSFQWISCILIKYL